MTTITDIADALDVSPATVSRALNQSRLISPELTERITATAHRLGYTKRIIRRHRSRAILNIKLVLPHHSEPERALFYDLATLTEGIRTGFSHCGINLLCETASRGFRPFPHKKGGDLDGFIFAFNRPTASTLRELRTCGTPFVVLNREIPGMPCVALENAEGFAMLIAHLHSRINDLKPAFVTLNGLGQIGRERLAGMTAACAQHGLPFDETDDTFRFPGISTITTAAVRSMAARHNALLCANDIIGTVVVAELGRLGVSIPSQVAVTGFDNSPLRNLSRPLLTTVSMPIAELAAAAASGLEKQIIEHTSPTKILRLPGTLIPGESS